MSQDVLQLLERQFGHMIMSGCAECLLQWRGDPDSPAGRRLDRLYFEALQMWTAVQVGYPDRVKVGSYFGISAVLNNRSGTISYQTGSSIRLQLSWLSFRGPAMAMHIREEHPAMLRWPAAHRLAPFLPVISDAIRGHLFTSDLQQLQGDIASFLPQEDLQHRANEEATARRPHYDRTC